MFSCCRCCARRHERPAPATKCRYCDGFPHTEQGGCLGVHGEALEHYLDELVANGFWTRELAEWWLRRDADELARRAG